MTQTREATMYLRTWLYGIHYNLHDPLPQNFISATPFKLFGLWPGFRLVLAKSDYLWACSCAYNDPKMCKAKLHGDDYWKAQIT